MRWIARQISGLFPFLLSVRHLLWRGNWFRGICRYAKEYRQYQRACRPESPFPLRFLETYPQLFDRFEQAGTVPRHYFLQDLWAARKVFAARPPVHHDIGSRLDGFIAHCLAFTKVVMCDVRPLAISVPNLAFCQAQAERMDQIPTGSITSLSCLHALEHFGLGRYGDPVNPAAHLTAAIEMQRILAPAGNLYLAVPIGRERLEFNAHRVFDPATIRELFAGLELVEFSAVGDDDELHEQADWRAFRGSRYACGLFWFRKPAAAGGGVARTAVT